ncbi:cysteine dioxygenase [Candidimonas sp. SYP-B2681]|uniref:cysteine dioxygenase family protein n=1 Tax=Candidimonas sp. SYP-B2681 TaxID=2497686 RepID=UPI000F874B37|nr:cysteine dioxygenase [Candidimonas sp. SYP-B2681]RTZ41519.1 cysteine dioxygenase [Candidimonas sp. SYP-B2681]
MDNPKIGDLVAKMNTTLAHEGLSEAQILDQAKSLMQDLIRQDDWLDDAYAQPHPVHYQQYPLYVCPQGRFSLVSFVWGPGQSTPVHDHTVWGVIGMLRGAEIAESYERLADGGIRLSGRTELRTGMIDCVSPTIGDIHRVANRYDDRVSISIHLYGADIGAVKRHVFNPETGDAKPFTSGYAQPVLRP